jgi:hypothetical protein
MSSLFCDEHAEEKAAEEREIKGRISSDFSFPSSAPAVICG